MEQIIEEYGVSIVLYLIGVVVVVVFATLIKNFEEVV